MNRVSTAAFPSSGLVHLNVGGTIFMTTVETLTSKSGFFQALARKENEPMKSMCTVDGAFFIDRDGTHFGHLLEYMRGGLISQLKVTDKAALLKEADFFSMDDNFLSSIDLPTKAFEVLDVKDLQNYSGLHKGRRADIHVLHIWDINSRVWKCPDGHSPDEHWPAGHFSGHTKPNECYRCGQRGNSREYGEWVVDKVPKALVCFTYAE